jgi:hypothetical protein
MSRALGSSVITTLAIVVAAFVCATGADLQSQLPQSQWAGLAPAGAITVHPAMKYDVSQSLASMREAHGTTTLAECEGPECGTSPSASGDDPEAAQDQGADEAIPQPPPPPTLSPAGIAVEQTFQGTSPTMPLVESFDGLVG